MHDDDDEGRSGAVYLHVSSILDDSQVELTLPTFFLYLPLTVLVFFRFMRLPCLVTLNNREGHGKDIGSLSTGNGRFVVSKAAGRRYFFPDPTDDLNRQLGLLCLPLQSSICCLSVLPPFFSLPFGCLPRPLLKRQKKSPTSAVLS